MVNQEKIRQPSTGNPADYVEVYDLTDIGKGKHVGYRNMAMPSNANEALLVIVQNDDGFPSEGDLKKIEEAKVIFQEVMGFSFEDLEKIKKEKAKNL